MHDWISLALDRHIVRRAALCALIVGTILIAINHGDALLAGELSPRRALQMGLTVLVPYCVSTVSSVGAVRSLQRNKSL